MISTAGAWLVAATAAAFMKEFERNVKAISNPQVQQWAEGTLPLLKEHLRQARQIATSIGIDTAAR